MALSIIGKDTIVIADRVLVDFADQDNASLVFGNNLFEVKVGKNKNAMFAKNETGNQAELTLRILRGSTDDVFLQTKLTSLERNPTEFTLLNGSIVKKIGDGQGNVANDVYTLEGGVFSKHVETKENAEADTEQNVSVYVITFAKAKRSIS